MIPQNIKANLSQAIYDLSSYELEGKLILKKYPIESQERVLKEVKRLKSYILRYLKLFNELSQEQQADFMKDRKAFLIKARLLK